MGCICASCTMSPHSEKPPPSNESLLGLEAGSKAWFSRVAEVGSILSSQQTPPHSAESPVNSSHQLKNISLTYFNTSSSSFSSCGLLLQGESAVSGPREGLRSRAGELLPLPSSSLLLLRGELV